MKSNDALLGFIGGIAAGAVLGILFAPEKGSETRKKIKTKSTDLAEDLKSKYVTLANKLSKEVDSVEAKSEELLKEGKSTIEHINKNIVKEA